MSGGNVVGSQKEMTAVINNLKESRVLDKAIDTLSLEESYSVKLLNLNTKMVNLQYSRLQGNVSRIKTNLSMDDISSMRSLEQEGKFKSESLIASSSSQSKIAAAEKRLKFHNPNQRSVSAMPRLGKNVTPKIPNLQTESSTSNVVALKKARPQTSALTSKCQPRDGETNKPSRPNTAAILQRIATAQKARKNFTCQTTYSCHDGKGNHGSGIASDIFGPNPYEIRRTRFLTDEYKTRQILAIRSDAFLKKTSTFITKNPCFNSYKPRATSEVINSIDSITARPGRWDHKKKLPHSEIDLIRRILLTDDRNRRDALTGRMIEKWKKTQQTSNNSEIFATRLRKYK